MFSDLPAGSPLDGAYQNVSSDVQKCQPLSSSPRARDRQLFNALDGQTIGGRWTVRVYSIHALGAERYLQLEVVGDSPQHAIAKLSATATAPAVLAALEAWASDDDPSTRILHVD